MGCRCCRMIKSYIYDPSAVGEPGKSELSGSGGRGSLYQPRGPQGGGDRQKEGVSNLAYSKSNEGTLKLEADNNHVNRLQGAPAGGAALYIIQPPAPGPRCAAEDGPRPSQVPVYPAPPDYGGGGRRSAPAGWDTEDQDQGGGGAAEDRGGVAEDRGGVAEDWGGAGDGGSALSVDVLTSTTSVSSADERDGPPPWAPRTAEPWASRTAEPWASRTAEPWASTADSGISMTKSEEEEGEGEGEEEEGRRRWRRQEESEDVRSVTDSMVTEALAALEAATAGEEFE